MPAHFTALVDLSTVKAVNVYFKGIVFGNIFAAVIDLWGKEISSGVLCFVSFQFSTVEIGE